MKNKTKNVLLYVLSGVVLSLAIGIAPAPYVAKSVVTKIFEGRASTASILSGSMEASIYKFRSSFPSLANRTEYTLTSDGNKLKAYSYQAMNNNGGLVLIAHGMGSMSDGKESGFADYFLSANFDVLQLDLTASGNSEGSSHYLDQSVDDVLAGLKLIHETAGLKEKKIFLLGYSWGAYGCLASLHYDQSPVAVTSLAGFASPDKEMIQYASRYMGMGLAKATKAFMDTALYEQRGSEGFLSAIKAINESKASIYLAQGGMDKSVSYDYSGAYADTKWHQRSDPFDPRISKKRRPMKSVFLSDAAVSLS
jgi:pimeloyl-ACP methyl ester carboxylesterase